MAWRSQGRSDIQVDQGSGERRAAKIEETRRQMQERLASGLRTSRINFADELAETTDEASNEQAARAFGASRLEEMLAEAGRQERKKR